jgi:hypothetical protein
MDVDQAGGWFPTSVINDGSDIYTLVSADFTKGTALYKISMSDFTTGTAAVYTGLVTTDVSTWPNK